MKKKLLSLLKILIFIGLGAFFIVWFFKNMTPLEREELLESFKSVNYFWVFIACITNILAHVLRTLRWKQLMQPLNYSPRFRITFGAVMIGYFANLAVPRLGEVIRCGILNRYEKIPIQKSLGTVITERATDMITFFLIIIFCFFADFDILKDYLYNSFWLKFNLPNFTILIIILLTLASFFFFLCWIFRKQLLQLKFVVKLKELFLGFWDGIKSIASLHNPLLFIIYSIAIWALYLLGLYFIFLCFPETAHLPLKAALIGLVLGSVGVMITPGGIGLYPLLIRESLAIYSVSSVLGGAIGWISWGTQQIGVIIIGMISLIGFSITSSKRNGKARNNKEKNS